MDDTTAGGNTPADAPLTFADAYAADTSPVSDTSATETTTPPAAAQPATPTAPLPQAPEDRSPYVTRARFDELNTRMKAAEEWKGKYGWAESVDQSVLTEAAQWYGRYKGDPVDFVQQLIADMQAHPEHSAKLRSIAARALAQGQRSQSPAPGSSTPVPIIQLEDGTTVDLNALKQQWLQEAEAKFEPALQTAAEFKAEREERQAQAKADTFATDFLTEVRALPDFATHEAAIKSDLGRLIAAGKVGDHPAELRDAVRTLYIKHAIPAREATAQSRHLDDLQRKAAASTGINPGASAPTSARRPTSFADKSLKW